MKYLGVTYHRNGQFGTAFYAVRFEWTTVGKSTYRGTAIVFDAAGHIAILADGEHGTPDIHIPFRYEDIDKELRAYVAGIGRRALAP
jgi:hypothetical protein